MSTQNLRTPLTILAVAVVLAAVTYLLVAGRATPPPPASAPVAGPTDQTPEEATTTEPGSVARPTTTRPRVSYGDVVLQYGERRVQFNESCEATPGQVTFKNNTTVMFDSRSEGRRVLTIDGRRYTINGDGYVLVRLSSPTLPYSVSVDCDNGRNNAVILLQS